MSTELVEHVLTFAANGGSRQLVDGVSNKGTMSSSTPDSTTIMAETLRAIQYQMELQAKKIEMQQQLMQQQQERMQEQQAALMESLQYPSTPATSQPQQPLSAPPPAKIEFKEFSGEVED